jgi:alpha-mannosidase
VLPGSSIQMVYEDAIQYYQEIEKCVNKMKQEVYSQIISETEISLLVFNSLNWERIEIMELPEKYSETSLQQSASKKPLGIIKSSGLGLKPIQKQHEIYGKCSILEENNYFILENQYLLLKVSKVNGNIESIFIKSDERELLESDGNLYVLYDDTPRDHDAWDVYDYYLQKKEILKACSVEIHENGPLLR